MLHSWMERGVDWYIHLIFNYVIKIYFIDICIELHFNEIRMFITNDANWNQVHDDIKFTVTIYVTKSSLKDKNKIANNTFKLHTNFEEILCIWGWNSTCYVIVPVVLSSGWIITHIVPSADLLPRVQGISNSVRLLVTPYCFWTCCIICLSLLLNP